MERLEFNVNTKVPKIASTSMYTVAGITVHPLSQPAGPPPTIYDPLPRILPTSNVEAVAPKARRTKKHQALPTVEPAPPLRRSRRKRTLTPLRPNQSAKDKGGERGHHFT